jgi:hypothetical protein
LRDEKIKRFGHRWEDNIKTDLKQIDCENINWNDGGLG